MLPDTILAFNEQELRRRGFAPCVHEALSLLCRPDLNGFWLHLDVDFLSHEILPAADFTQGGGLGWDELGPILVKALGTGKAVGMEITIFNAELEPDGAQAKKLVAFLAGVFDAVRSADGTADRPSRGKAVYPL